MSTPGRIALADLSAASIRLHPSHAAAITWLAIQQVQQHGIAGIPTIETLRLMEDGSVSAEGEVPSGDDVERAGRLLEALLPDFDAPAELRAPGALRIVVARALRTLDLPAYRSLDEFAQALQRFVPSDPREVVRSLYTSGVAEATPPPSTRRDDTALTISDIRRARRSTGLTLSEIALRTHIPVSLLRELEWGYFPNWPSDQYGRVQLVRYARAAGLDEQLVIEVVWPLLQHAIRARAPRVVDADVVDEPVAVPVEPAPLMMRPAAVLQAPARHTPSVKRRTFQAALAIAALLAVSFVPALWQGSEPPQTQTSPAAPAVETSTGSPDAKATPTARADVPPPQTPPPASVSAPPSPQPIPSQPPPVRLREDVAFSPAFATTGSAMFYHSAARGNSAILRADTDANGDVLRVTRIVNDDAQNFHARPSPDGRMIAFDSNRDGTRAVFVADADGHNVRRVSGAGFAAVPSWSPDGGRLTFVRAEPEQPRVWNLWMLDLATGETTRLTSHRVGQPWGAAWFPDGKRIAYSHEDRLIVRTLDGSAEQIYRSPRKGRLLRTPAVSPDGRQIVFQVYRDGAWVLNLEDASMRKILTDPTAEEFSWSPDGGRLAYHSRKSGTWSVWIMAPR
jgi:hypothetical protein